MKKQRMIEIGLTSPGASPYVEYLFLSSRTSCIFPFCFEV